MKKEMMMTLGILILLVLSCFLPSVIGFSSDSEEAFSFKSRCQAVGDIIIVDDEGDGDYTSIKEAINNSNPGDTIEVYSGTYYEHTIVIETDNIALEGISYELGNGSDTGKPFINGEGKNYVFLFDAKNIILDSFHIENKDGTHHDIIDLSQNAEGCIISNNDLAYTSICLIFVQGSDNTIINNNISHSLMRQGITLYKTCSNCIVSGNVISYVERGVECWGSNSNTITGNKISRCRQFGVLLNGNYNIIKGNTFEYNAEGVRIDYGIGNRIKKNNFINNQEQAHFLYYIPIFLGLTNRWRGNYWGEPRSTPYPILGVYMFILPWYQFDWFPAKEPYDI